MTSDQRRRFGVLSLVVVIAAGLLSGWGSAAANALQTLVQSFASDPDLPPNLPANFDKAEYLRRRSEQVGYLRGIYDGSGFDPLARGRAITQMDRQLAIMSRGAKGTAAVGALSAWTALGPAPIPNGQTTAVSVPVSGRVTAIAIHPTNPNLVYVGTAQGGVYRTLDGGATWTPMMDSALSLSIGAIAIAPSQTDTVYVGTGELNLSSDSFFGVGLYRIDNASTASPVLTGPLNHDASHADVFSGRGIGKIVVHPTLPGTIFVSSGSATAGRGGVAPLAFPARGLYRSIDATSADPTFTKMTLATAAGQTPLSSQNQIVIDILMDPANPDLVLCTLMDSFGQAQSEGGIYRSTSALAASPTFTRTYTAGSGTSLSRIQLATSRATLGPMFFGVSGGNGGSFLQSADFGVTWTLKSNNQFCYDQCAYDMAIAASPTYPGRVYVGGSSVIPFGYSTNDGASFTSAYNGLHADTHAIAVSASAPNIIYVGSDGGIFKSTDSGSTWSSLNNTQFSATQFQSLAVHPTDRYFTIGGTQDNGTNFLRPDQTWTRAESGDGGFAVIDQNATNTSAVTMYHTFYNLTSSYGYSRSLDAGTSWHVYGCGFGSANGLDCNNTTAILFYAPLERGPGNPNSLYFGADALYRSGDAGATMVKVSQQPIGGAISAIGISAQSDAVRIVGTNTGGIWGTSSGASTLVDLDALGAVPNNYIARAVIDPNNSTTAYVTLSAYGVNSVWKTTNLSAANPTWTAAANGLPQVPVTAFVVDPAYSAGLYAGTDIGVYYSTDGGANWAPFGTGLPRVAVFDMAIQNSFRRLRIATHGRGLYDIALPALFTDDTLGAGVTGIKSVHITELRTRINAIRAARGLSAFSFTDPTLSAGSTGIRAVHITELRTALSAAYSAAGLPLPSYTDSTLTANMAIKAVHIAELRAAVLGIE